MKFLLVDRPDNPELDTGLPCVQSMALQRDANGQFELDDQALNADSGLQLLIGALGGVTGVEVITERACRQARRGAQSLAILAVPLSGKNSSHTAIHQQIDAIRASGCTTIVIDDPMLKRSAGGILPDGSAWYRIERKVRDCAMATIRLLAGHNPYKKPFEDILAPLLASTACGFATVDTGKPEGPGQALRLASDNAVKWLPDGAASVRTVIVAFGGAPEYLRWSDIKPAQDSIRRILGDAIPLLFIRQPDADRGATGIRTDVWVLVS